MTDPDPPDHLDETDDLARLLAYRDAAVPVGPGDVVEVAPDIVQFPCWTPAFCAAIVRAAELVGRFEPDPDDPVPGHEVSLAAISPRLVDHLQVDMGRRVWPLLQERWPLVEYHGVRDAFVIRYEPGGQQDLRLHHDIAQVSASIRLDDDYEGAELAFPRQGWDNARQPVGSMVAWPSLVTHPHEVRPLRAGTKHGLTIWFELPMDVLSM